MVSLDRAGPASGFSWARMAINQLEGSQLMQTNQEYSESHQLKIILAAFRDHYNSNLMSWLIKCGIRY